MTVPMSDTERNAVDLVIQANPWLEELGSEIYDLVVQLVTEAMPPSLIAGEIRQTEVYKARFAGMEIRRKEGLPTISEAEYLETEAMYQTQLRNYEVYDLLFSSDSDFKSWAAEQIGQDISNQELSIRLDRGWASVENNAQVTEAFQQFYGVTPSKPALLLYFLDPEKGTYEIEREVAAAIIGGEALSYGLNISRTRAELFASQGVTQQMARAGYADIAREEPLLQDLARIHRFTPLTQTDLEDFFFHEDPEVAKRRATTFNTALAQFSGPTADTGSGFPELLDIRRTV